MERCLGCLGVTRSTDAASALGVSRRDLRDLVGDGVVVTLRRGVLVGSCTLRRAAEDPTAGHLLRLSALILAHPGCVASHESAALVHGLPLLDVPRRVVATRAHGAWRGGTDQRIRIAPLPAHDIEIVGGIPATSVPRTSIDIARTLGPRAALVTGDVALARCGSAEIERALGEAASWADLGPARRAVARFDARSESPLESLSRAVFFEFELPVPELQASIETVAGKTYRVDFFWPDQRVVGEADGLGKYDDPGALRAEKIRQEHLEQSDCRVVRWTWRDMAVDTADTVQRIVRALRR